MIATSVSPEAATAPSAGAEASAGEPCDETAPIDCDMVSGSLPSAHLARNAHGARKR